MAPKNDSCQSLSENRIQPGTIWVSAKFSESCSHWLMCRTLAGGKPLNHVDDAAL